LDRIPVEPEVTLAFMSGLTGGHGLTNICRATALGGQSVMRLVFSAIHSGSLRSGRLGALLLALRRRRAYDGACFAIRRRNSREPNAADGV
jgi:hypothetical protein